MHNYQGEHGRLPPAVVYGADGTALHSWRILLLPYLEQRSLYERFKLDEPWDSPSNQSLLREMPSVYGPFDGSEPAEPYTTFYQVFVGPGTAFEGREGLRLNHDFPDGTSNTLLIVEAGTAVPWTRPVDLTYAADRPLPKLGGIFKGSFRAALCDGSVRTVMQDRVSETTLRAVITRNGGERIGSDWIQ